jgi:hypothetical protein
MKRLCTGLVLTAGLLLGGVAQAQAPAADAQKAAAEKAAKEKAAAAKEAEILGKYQDKAVANYKKNKAAKK